MGYKGCQGCIGADREFRCSGASTGIRGIGMVLGCRALGAVGGIGPSGGVGVSGCIGGGRWTGSQPHWAPVQGPSTSTGSPWGVTNFTKARQGPLSRVPSPPLVSLGE